MMSVFKIKSHCQNIALRGVVNKLKNSSRSNEIIPCTRCFCGKKSDETSNENVQNSRKDLSSPLSTLEKYKIFKDSDSPPILDIIEERFKALQLDEKPRDEYEGLNVQRGREGVFDIEDIVELLRREKAENIFVMKIPQEYKYVNYVVVVTGKSVRHMKGLAEFVRKMYKRKRNNSDTIPVLEGEGSKDWMAMDLGNIALHIFSENTRLMYDLESLWSIGSEFDELSQQSEDPLIELLQKHSVYLGDLQPANTTQ